MVVMMPLMVGGDAIDGDDNGGENDGGGDGIDHTFYVQLLKGTPWDETFSMLSILKI